MKKIIGIKLYDVTFETIRDKGLKISSHLDLTFLLFDLQQKNIFDVKNMKKIFAKVLFESYEKFRYLLKTSSSFGSYSFLFYTFIGMKILHLT